MLVQVICDEIKNADIMKKRQDFNPAFKDELSENQFAKSMKGYFEIDYTGDNVSIKAVFI